MEEEAGWAIGQLKLGAARQTGQAHILYNEATLAALFFLHTPETWFPNLAVVDPLKAATLRAIAEKAGFSRETIDTWEKSYLVIILK